MRGQSETRFEAAVEAVAKLDADFFRGLERAGGRRWPEAARTLLMSIVYEYWLMSIRPETGDWQSRKVRERKIQNAADKLHEELVASSESQQEFFSILLNYCHTGVDGTVRPDAARMLSGLNRARRLDRFQWNDRENLDCLMFQIAGVFKAIGGDVKISPEGPLARILREIYKVLPCTTCGPSSPDALVRRAEERRIWIKQMVDMNPATLDDVPEIGPKFSSETR